MNVPRTGNKYEGEETNSQFRFEIYKLNYLENDVREKNNKMEIYLFLVVSIVCISHVGRGSP